MYHHFIEKTDKNCSTNTGGIFILTNTAIHIAVTSSQTPRYPEFHLRPAISGLARDNEEPQFYLVSLSHELVHLVLDDKT